jgi:hypothetical protein
MLVMISLLASGCASFQQASDTALIREPGNRIYSAPADVSGSARALWEYAYTCGVASGSLRTRASCSGGAVPLR